MKRHARNAFTQLKAMGVPVLPGNYWGEGSHFEISGEDNFPEIWADYYEDLPAGWDFGVNPKINRVLAANGLYHEWINAGVLGVYDR